MEKTLNIIVKMLEMILIMMWIDRWYGEKEIIEKLQEIGEHKD